MDSEVVVVPPAVPPVVPPAAEKRKRRPIVWQDVACVGPIVLSSIYYYVGIPLNALLIGTRPILLSALRGSTAAMIATGGFARVGKASLVAAILAPVPISMVADPFYFWAGRRYGRKVIEYFEQNDPRWRRRIARGERFFARWGVWTVVFAPFLPVPSALFYLAAGEAGMRLVIFLLADLLGTLLYVGLWVGAGWIAGQHAVDIAETITHYAWWIVGGTFLLILIYSFWSAWRAPPPEEIEKPE